MFAHAFNLRAARDEFERAVTLEDERHRLWRRRVAQVRARLRGGLEHVEQVELAPERERAGNGEVLPKLVMRAARTSELFRCDEIRMRQPAFPIARFASPLSSDAGEVMREIQRRLFRAQVCSDGERVVVGIASRSRFYDKTSPVHPGSR